LLFDSANAKKLANCGISVLDTPQEVVPAMLAYLGHDPKSRDLRDLGDAIIALEKIRPHIRKFHSSEYINDLANEDLCLSLGYSGDVIMARNRARDAHNGVEIAFSVPKEGAQMSVDMLGIPADASHPQNALRFIDYLLRPEVIADISNAVTYPNPNIPGTALVKPAIRDDPAVYPPPEIRRRFFVDLPAPPDYERARTRAWTRLKSGE
jgi:putrescine transport system substrate-binding protein